MAPPDPIYSRAEVNRILRKASEIQAEENGEEAENGLTEDELLQVAGEAGIDRKVMLRALREYDLPGKEGRFDWLRGTTSLQKKAVLEGEVTDERWQELVRDIREITGGIGKVHTGGQTYEWEQRKRNTGYIHLSATPGEGRTVLQFVSNWNSHRMSVSIISFTVFFALASMAIQAAPLSDFLQLLSAAGAGLAGVGVGRFFLRSFYESQKERMQQIFQAFARRLQSGAPERDRTSESGQTQEGGRAPEGGRLDLEEAGEVPEISRRDNPAATGPSRARS